MRLTRTAVAVAACVSLATGALSAPSAVAAPADGASATVAAATNSLTPTPPKDSGASTAHDAGDTTGGAATNRPTGSDTTAGAPSAAENTGHAENTETTGNTGNTENTGATGQNTDDPATLDPKDRDELSDSHPFASSEPGVDAANPDDTTDDSPANGSIGDVLKVIGGISLGTLLTVGALVGLVVAGINSVPGLPEQLRSMFAPALNGPAH